MMVTCFYVRCMVLALVASHACAITVFTSGSAKLKQDNRGQCVADTDCNVGQYCQKRSTQLDATIGICLAKSANKAQPSGSKAAAESLVAIQPEDAQDDSLWHENDYIYDESLE